MYKRQVQAAGNLIGAAPELASRVQLGKDHLHRGHFHFRMLIDRHTASVVYDGYGIIFVDAHLNGCLLYTSRCV